MSCQKRIAKVWALAREQFLQGPHSLRSHNGIVSSIAFEYGVLPNMLSSRGSGKNAPLHATLAWTKICLTRQSLMDPEGNLASSLAVQGNVTDHSTHFTGTTYTKSFYVYSM